MAGRDTNKNLNTFENKAIEIANSWPRSAPPFVSGCQCLSCVGHTCTQTIRRVRKIHASYLPWVVKPASSVLSPGVGLRLALCSLCHLLSRIHWKTTFPSFPLQSGLSHGVLDNGTWWTWCEART